MEPVGDAAKAFVASAVGQGLLTDESLWFRLLSPQGEYLYVSPRVKEFLGYVPSEFLTMPASDFIAFDEYEAAEEVLAALPKGPISAIYRMKHKNGEYVWVNSHLQLVDGMMLVLGRSVPERLKGVAWKHVEPFL